MQMVKEETYKNRMISYTCSILWFTEHETSKNKIFVKYGRIGNLTIIFHFNHNFFYKTIAILYVIAVNK